MGRLGTFVFPVGWYFYAGSALRGLERRVGRHARREKPLRWHIDYLSQWAPVKEVWVTESAQQWECAWAHIAQNLPGSAVPVPSFGASDCHCPSHLLHYATQPLLPVFTAALAQAGFTDPLARWVLPGQMPQG